MLRKGQEPGLNNCPLEELGGPFVKRVIANGV